MPSSPAGIKARACSHLPQIGDLGLSEQALHQPAMGAGIPGVSHSSEWGAQFCLLHLFSLVGTIAVRGLLGCLAGTERHHAGLLGPELQWG